MPAPITVATSLSLWRRVLLPPMGNCSLASYSTGVASRVVRMNEIPFKSFICSTNTAVEVASLGYSTVEPHTARIMARSSSAIWLGPSSPMETPAWLPHSFMLACEMAPMRIWS
jgi:hypothetical protein